MIIIQWLSDASIKFNHVYIIFPHDPRCSSCHECEVPSICYKCRSWNFMKLIGCVVDAYIAISDLPVGCSDVSGSIHPGLRPFYSFHKNLLWASKKFFQRKSKAFLLKNWPKKLPTLNGTKQLQFSQTLKGIHIYLMTDLETSRI